MDYEEEQRVPAGIYQLKINNIKARTNVWNMFKISNKPPKRRQWRRFGGLIVNFEHISHLCSSVSIVNFEYVIAHWGSTWAIPLLTRRSALGF